ncbi:alpha-1A adrenergic receptor [Bombina bombina]|uniref:alpha-1A adrenergic receptor n=1 Tax=Bombina bombina TaxID=8345 RepID=UPI00235B02EE|nr:alpha-1A adrenergic receptor [Bombina bombina]
MLMFKMYPAVGMNTSGSPLDLLNEITVDGNVTAENNQTANQTLPALNFTRAIVLGFTLGAFIVMAIVGNIMVILSVVTNRHLRIPTNYLIVNLAIADLLLSSTVLPFSATLEIVAYWVFGRIFCDIWAAMDVLCCTASIFSLCAISIDRYIGVRYSLQYPTIVTRKRAILALLGVWVLSTVISVGPLLGWKQPAPPDELDCEITTEPFYALFSSLGSFYIPLIVILVMYCRVYIVAKKITKNLEAGVMKEKMDSKELTLRIHCRNIQEDSSKSQQPRSSLALKLMKFSREKKAAKTLGIVVGMFILCWLPFFTNLPIIAIFQQLKPSETVQKIIFWLGYFNSCINPIIYPCSSKEFKRAFIRILKCQWSSRKKHGFRRSQTRPRSCSTFDNSRKDSLDEYGQFINGSQKTMLSRAPSPSYLNKVTQPLEKRTHSWKRSHSPKELDSKESHDLKDQENSCSVFTFKAASDYNGHNTDKSGFSTTSDMFPIHTDTD